MYLQSYVLPVCGYKADATRPKLIELFGTAFFINRSGVFLTARHVLESAVVNCNSKGLKFGLRTMTEIGGRPFSSIIEIDEHEFAPLPFDIAIGKTSFTSETLLTIGNFPIAVWKDIGTQGYPLSIVDTSIEHLNIDLRAHKGYIQRIVRRGEMKLLKNPDAFELSFQLSRGMSGSPLFIHSEPKDIVIGICVASIRTEETDFELVEVLENGNTYKESRLKIEQFGFAHDIRPLNDWKPSILGGKSLRESFHE